MPSETSDRAQSGAAPPDSAPLLILGSRIFAEEVADLVLQCPGQTLAGFVENLERDRCNERLLGLPVHWIDDVAPLAGDHLALCAIGTNRRRGFVERAASIGFSFGTVIHPSACVSPSAEVGAGCVISAGAVIGTRTSVGHQTIVNRGTLIGHHTEIGSYVTISPGSNIAGCVRIGDNASIGMGAIVLDRIEVGTGALIGAGAVVTRDVPPNTQVMGVPARVVRDGVDGR